jgi:hypothetical protein
MNTPKYWPLDFDPEDEIYENPSWDLPGFRGAKAPGAGKKDSSVRKPAPRGKHL